MTSESAFVESMTPHELASSYHWSGTQMPQRHGTVMIAFHMLVCRLLFLNLYEVFLLAWPHPPCQDKASHPLDVKTSVNTDRYQRSHMKSAVLAMPMMHVNGYVVLC